MKKHFTLPLLAVSSIVLTAGFIDLNNLFNYANQPIPTYILKDNTPAENPITNKGATLGRVLFYDKKLSLDNSTACASCHHQTFAFGDTAVLSQGIRGLTTRHAMRLVNVRFSDEHRFFWDERAATLENQVTRPIQDHIEMGFSGKDDEPGIDSLLRKMKNTDYYPTLFSFVFGNPEITEQRMQKALAQFVRSIQSFDSKFDAGRVQVKYDSDDFPNFTQKENEGKTLFLTLPTDGGAGCFRCHAAPEFSIDPKTLNNGFIGVAGNPNEIDLSNTRAPSLRDLINPNGILNGPLMHTGQFKYLFDAINHYNYLTVNPLNTNLDPRLAGAENDLTLSKAKKESLVLFLKTLTGEEIYVNEKWSNPFESDGSLEILPIISGTSATAADIDFRVFPNPTAGKIQVQIEPGKYQIEIRDAAGRLVFAEKMDGSFDFDFSENAPGVYKISIFDSKTGRHFVKKVVKR